MHLQREQGRERRRARWRAGLERAREVRGWEAEWEGASSRGNSTEDLVKELLALLRLPRNHASVVRAEAPLRCAR